MVSHTQNLCFAFHPSKCTLHPSSEQTHRAVSGHFCCGARGAVGGSVPFVGFICHMYSLSISRNMAHSLSVRT